MAEQFAVDDVGGDRLAVDLDQRPAGAEAGGVDRAGEGFLAAAGLADDQDRQAVARGLGGDRQRGAEIGRGADQLLERSGRARSFRTTGASSPVGAAAVGMGGERFEQPLGRDRLGQEIGGAGAHRVDRQRHRAAVGEHDDRQVRPARAQGARSAPGRFAASQLTSKAARTSRPCGPGAGRPRSRASAAPTVLQPAREATADNCRRSLASASTSNSDRRTTSSRMTGGYLAQRSKGPLKRAKKALGRRRLGLLRPPPTEDSNGRQNMADDKAHPTATEMDYPAHVRNYDGFIKLFKYGAIVAVHHRRWSSCTSSTTRAARLEDRRPQGRPARKPASPQSPKR